MAQVLNNSLFVGFRDIRGRQSDSNWTMLDQSNQLGSRYIPLMAALAACSNAAPFGVYQQLVAAVPYKATNAVFSDIFDQAVIQVSSVFEKGLIAFPAPKSTLFGADGTVLRMSDPAVVQLVAEARKVLGDSLGNPWVSWGPGFRRTLPAYPI
jgi:hypothetical protein